MTIWAISDLHLCFGVPEKSMEIFGPNWSSYVHKIEKNWRSCVAKEDLVLISGDISWAMRLEDALADLKWIDELPGTKLIIKGNHDYWWPSSKKLNEILPSSIHFIHNNAFNWNDVSIGGTRLWDSPEFSFSNPILQEGEGSEIKTNAEKIFERELQRLELSLKQLNPNAKFKICMTHYPPVSEDLKISKASEILEKYHINFSVFGHLHGFDDLKKEPFFGNLHNVKYILTSADYLNFQPIKICE